MLYPLSYGGANRNSTVRAGAGSAIARGGLGLRFYGGPALSSRRRQAGQPADPDAGGARMGANHPICRDLRCAVRAGPRPGALPDLRGRAAVRPAGGPAVDDAGRSCARTATAACCEQEAHGLWGIGTDPRFAIGQRALLVPGEGGNLLWDCVTYLDDDTIEAVNKLGGISAIAISHPHYYSTMIDWSEAFGGVPIYIHARDKQWVQRTGNVDSLGRRVGRGAARPHPATRPGSTSPAGPSCTGRRAPTAGERCAPATSSRSSRTGGGSASCTATRT